MAKRTFLRRINRGLLLAAALVIVLVVYLSINSITLNRSTAMEFINDYNSQVVLLNTCVKDGIGKNGLSDADAKRLQAQADKLASLYYDIDADIYNLDYFCKNYGLNGGYISDMEVIISSITSFKQLGQSYASCIVKYSLTYTCIGNADCYFAGNVDYNAYVVYEEYDDKNKQNVTDIKPETKSDSGEIEYVLHFVDGAWRIKSESKYWGW